MDIGFLLVVFSIFLPFLILALAYLNRNDKNQDAELQRLMRRVGFEIVQRQTLQQKLAEKNQNSLLLWLSSQLKRGGLQNKSMIYRLLVAQAIVTFVSAYLLIIQLDLLDNRTMFGAMLLPILPALFILFKIKKRQNQLKKQFPEMLDSITRGLQSGYGIDGALSMIAEEFAAPLGTEMKEVNRQQVLGISMRDILREFQRRVDIPEAQFFVVTLILQRETGGQLAAILGELSTLMRRRETFQQKIKTLTAESRFTAWFIGGAPVGYLGYKYFFAPETMVFFLEDPTGREMLLASIGLIIAGALILRSMLKMRF